MKSGPTSNPESLPAVKARVRSEYRAVREGKTTQQVQENSLALCQKLAEWNKLRWARRVMAYIAFRNELDLAPLFEMLPEVEWIVPRIVGKKMVLHPYNPKRLVRHRFGMLEPAADLPTIDPSTLDVVLVPGVAFDRRGGRMGFGGGFYDGFLPTTRALRVGISFDDCLLDEVPGDPHDQRMDWIITPTQALGPPRAVAGR